MQFFFGKRKVRHNEVTDLSVLVQDLPLSKRPIRKNLFTAS